MYVSFTKYDGEIFIYNADFTTKELEYLWNITKEVSQIEDRLKAIEDFSEATYRRFKRVEVESQFFT